MKDRILYTFHFLSGFHKVFPKWQQLIKDSFLSEDQKQAYEELVTARLDRL